MNKPEASSRIILYNKHSGEVLMSKGDTGSIKFLGGRIRRNIDESPLDAAIREAREEGGVDLLPFKSSIIELPFQDNDLYLSHWFVSILTQQHGLKALPGDDVEELFWVSNTDVEHLLTYQSWKEHWSTKLLPALFNI